MAISFHSAEAVRNAQTLRIERMLSSLYSELAKEQLKAAKLLEKIDNLSDPIQAMEMKKHARRLQNQVDLINRRIAKEAERGVKAVAIEVANINKQWLKSLGVSGISFATAYRNVPDDVVRAIISGKIYKTRDYLAKALWNYNKQSIEQIEKIVAKGLAANKGSSKIAKDLAKFVRPTAAKSARVITWVDKYGRVEKYYPGRVDYNALRLARTMLQHGYQQSLHMTLDGNPFLRGYRWIANGSRPCPICEERDNQIYAPDDLPFDHPNGMCDFEPIFDDPDYMASRLANWTKGVSDEEIDGWANSLF